MSKVIIGRGGFGEIFYLKNKPEMVYKESFRKCDDLYHEYSMWKKVYNAFIKYTRFQKGMRRHMCILRPSDWHISSNNGVRCMFKMARVVPLSGKYVWQAYMGNTEDPEMDRIVKIGNSIRGRYMGPKTLSKYFDVDKLAYEAGQLIGIVHYYAHLDGIDTELIIGKVFTSSNCRLFLIDYDQVQEWSSSTPETNVIRRLSWALAAEPYWPDIESPYHESFRKGYLKVAKKCGYEGLAKRVIKEM